MIRFIFIWFVFIGMSYCVRENIYLRVDLLETLLPRLKKALGIVQDLVFFAFCAYMIRPALSGIGMLWRNGQTSPAMDVPMYLVYASLLAGFVLSLFRLVQKWYRQIRGAAAGAPPREAKA
jgi:TRAP-type C4-dicarboxylate transport system permease small subunit